ncbi:MAG: DNA polymerase III subunit delta' [Pseudomonadota bacterium]
MSAPFPWQADAWQTVCAARAANRLHHALLVTGPPGIGKAEFIEALAGLLLCEQPAAGEPCGVCRGCQQHAAGSHPDCVVLSPDHERRPAFARYAGQRCQYDTKRKTPSVIINVEQVRELHDRLHASAHYGGYKLAVLLPADALNTAAANALLKLLEEPPDNTLFLLLSQRAAHLPATVRSRCQLLRLRTPPLALARGALPTSGGDADLALDLAGGAPLRARNLLSSDIAQVWRDVEAGCAGLLTGTADPLRLARDWIKLPQEALDAALYGWLRHALRRAGGDSRARVRQPAPPARLQAFAAELEDFMRLREHPLVKDLALQRLLHPLWTGG